MEYYKARIKKIILYFSSLTLVMFLVFNPFIARAAAAEEPEINSRFVPLPSSNIQPVGYLNRGNTGFLVEAQFNDAFKESYEKIALFLDSGAIPIGGEECAVSSNEEGKCTLSSQTTSLEDLKVLLDYDNPNISKTHQVFLRAQEIGTADFEVTKNIFPFIADFDKPIGTISYSVQPPSKINNTLKIGDKADFVFAPADPNEEIDSIGWSYNGRDLVSLGLLSGEYEVRDGDADQLIPLALQDVLIKDEAGNSYVVAKTDVTFTIDANAPKVMINSPENKAYNTNNLILDISIEGDYQNIIASLDGKDLDTSALPVPLNDLSDGNHEIVVLAEDEAGNVNQSQVSFLVDTTSPTFELIQNPDNQSIEKGEKIIFEGKTEPGAAVELEIFSDARNFETTADSNGIWRIEVDSNILEVGQHEAYLTFSDSLGNKIRILAAKFEVIEKEKITLALAKTSKPIQAEAVSDVSPAILPELSGAQESSATNDESLARNGQLLSSEDSREPTANWGAWIMILALIVLASALATASYYGYEWLTAPKGGTEPIYEKEMMREAKREERKIGRQPAAKIETEKPVETEKPKDEEPKARW